MGRKKGGVVGFSCNSFHSRAGKAYCTVGEKYQNYSNLKKGNISCLLIIHHIFHLFLKMNYKQKKVLAFLPHCAILNGSFFLEKGTIFFCVALESARVFMFFILFRFLSLFLFSMVPNKFLGFFFGTTIFRWQLTLYETRPIYSSNLSPKM